MLYGVQGMLKMFSSAENYFLKKNIKITLSISVSISTRLLLVFKIIVSGYNVERDESCLPYFSKNKPVLLTPDSLSF